MHRSTRLVLTILVATVLLATLAPLAAQERREQSAWMGVMLGRPDAAADADGVPLLYVVADSPAAEAGLRARDRLTAVNGVPISASRDLMDQLRKEAPGNWIPLTVMRGDDELDMRIRLGERPEDTGNLKKRRGWVGLAGIDLPPTLRDHFGAPEDAGVMISDVEPGSPAEAAGLRVGDVVYEIDGRPVRSLNAFHMYITTGGVGNTLVMLAARNGAEIEVETLVDDTPEQPAPLRRDDR